MHCKPVTTCCDLQGNCTGVPEVADDSTLPLPPLLPGQCVLQIRKRLMTISKNPSEGLKTGQLVENLLLRLRADWPAYQSVAAETSQWSKFNDISLIEVSVEDNAPTVWLSNLTFQGAAAQPGSRRTVTAVDNRISPVVLQGAACCECKCLCMLFADASAAHNIDGVCSAQTRRVATSNSHEFNQA